MHYVVCVPAGLILSLLSRDAQQLKRWCLYASLIIPTSAPWCQFSAVAVHEIRAGGEKPADCRRADPQSFLNAPRRPSTDCANIIWAGLGYKSHFLAGLKQIPRDLLRSRSIDGAHGSQMFFSNTCAAQPTIVYLSVTTTIQMLQVFTQIKTSHAGPGGPLTPQQRGA